MKRDYVIWSNQHRCWWNPNNAGYTRHVERAGRYTREEALDIAFRARDGWDRYEIPTEIAVRIEDLPAWAQVELNRDENAIDASQPAHPNDDRTSGSGGSPVA